MTWNARKISVCLLAAGFAASLRADDNARFDLVGPKIDVRVTRGVKTLPIAQVPNLLPGDKIWVKADLPATQSNHLILVVAFLRGTTNEPPDSWFTEIDTWEKKTAEGTTITVPDEAQQALLFVAPETGGDFKTLRSAVKGKPGLFIRADSDLNEGSFEQQRIERYLAAMKSVPADDAKAIQDHSAKLAATLALKPNADCFKQPPDQQVACLTQSKAPVLLEDGHGQGVAMALSTGAASDFINAASYTQAAGAGVYSAYVGAVVDLVHLVSLMRTAQYQYIPAISFPQDETLNLKLNAPPSFHNPKSVIVIGLPAIQKAKLPPLHAHDANQVACLLQPKTALQVEGAPLVFSTGFAHDMTLRLNRTGAPTELPLTADAYEGGLIVGEKEQRKPLNDGAPAGNDTKPGVKLASSTDVTVTGTVHGYWGFDSFDGPTLTLQQVDGKDWKIVGNTQLLAGQMNHLTLQGEGTGCVQHIALSDEKQHDVDVAYKVSDEKDLKRPLALDIALQKVQPGSYSLRLQQFGKAQPESVPVTAYTADIHLDRFSLHEGDTSAEIAGQGLKSVVSVQVADQTFKPAGDGNSDTLLRLQAEAVARVKDGADATATLKDGRTMPVKVSVQAARPGLQLMSFKAAPADAANGLAVTLGAKNDIPLAGKLTFVVQTKDAFPRAQTIEVATVDGAVHTKLSLSDNNLILQDEHTAVGTLEPLKAFGQSAFGKLQMRPVAADGTPGDWTPLGTLVRTPAISAVHCTSATPPVCTLEGSNLFLVQSFAASKEFTAAVDVPNGFAESSISVPSPADGKTLYLKLRDDQSSAASVTLPVPLAVPAAPAASSAEPSQPAGAPVAAPSAPAPPPT
jgi:hypothetical protein